MSLSPDADLTIPEETARVAHAACPKGSIYMRMRDELGPIYADHDFAALFPRRGQPAESPARLALFTSMQFAEGLSDRQAADAVRSRIDWKYALGLELTNPGFDASVLAEFRTRLLSGKPEQVLFEKMLERLRERQLLKARGRMRTDSTPVLAAVRSLNRLEFSGETLYHALHTLASVAPAWLRSWVPSAWFDRYGRHCEEYRLPPGRAERYSMAAQIAADGAQLLAAIDGSAAPAWLREVPAVQTLRQIWEQQFVLVDDKLQWREAEDLPPSAELIHSPYDVEARYSKKRQTEWNG
jgi:transposase